ncbi:MAG TPA: hypothetical protein VNH40_10580 [Gaiellaceae bacterium]|nr:hypothetical protein [Gaiellaceae bacterium]
MAIPHDLLDEIHGELAESCRALTREAERLAELIELQRLASRVSLHLGRSASMVEFFDELGDEPNERLAALVRSLRGEGPR